MTTENNHPENENKENSTENQSIESVQSTAAQIVDTKADFPKADMDTEASVVIPDEKALSETDQTAADSEKENANLKRQEEENDKDAAENRPTESLLKEMETILGGKNPGAEQKKFNMLKDAVLKKIQHETKTEEGAGSESHPLLKKVNELVFVFKEKYSEFVKNLEAEQSKNLGERQGIIDRLKNLYSNSAPGVNLFKEIREIKAAWTAAGQVSKSEFKNLNNNYFHHLNQFYQMLDMNKEYMEQEHAHNLEKRRHIIDRAKELELEPSVQKALNELQHLHKLWKEEAEPVAEEFRETTWEEFKAISNKIHDRRAELSAELEKYQAENLEKKTRIISEIKALAEAPKDAGHKYWQEAIKKIEELRTEFLALGSVPRKLSNQNWTEFKEVLKSFNNQKNAFYKNLKGGQQENLDNKLKLIQTAKDNMHSEDWETAVPLFKKLQDDWKTIGHVPRNMADKVWADFREACNTFFDNFREKNNAEQDNWKENYKAKTTILEELKSIEEQDDSLAKIEDIKNRWNAVGKVPREKLGINSEFNKVLKDKLRLNKASEFDLKEEGLTPTQITDKARKIKNQVGDLEAEIVKLENNLGFFADSSRNNPLLASTYKTIDDKKAQLESLKKSLHTIISHE